MSSKTTPAIRKAEQHLQNALAHLKASDLVALQHSVHDNRLDTDQQSALLQMLCGLQQLVEAEYRRDCGGEQQDMFGHLKEREFAAWKQPFNQRTLF